MAVEVYYWSSAPGHVAISVDGGSPPGKAYLSRYPGSLAVAVGVGGLAPWPATGDNHDYQQDIAKNGMPTVLRFTTLNETAIKRAIALCLKYSTYNDFVANCASHVRHCLESGLPLGAQIATGYTHGGLIGFVSGDTPWGVYRVAQALHTLYK